VTTRGAGISPQRTSTYDLVEESMRVVSSQRSMTPDAVWRRAAVASIVVATAPLVPWWVQRSASEEAWTGLLLIAVAIGLVARGPIGRPAPAAAAWLAIVGVVVVVTGWWVQIRLLQAAGIAALAAALVAVGTSARAPPWACLLLVWLGLPLSGDIDVIGFPLRLVSAELAASVLPALDVPVVFAETVLVTEHGLSDVEAACAGLSTLRLLLATIAVLSALRGASLASLVGAAGAAVVVAVLGNACRVTILSWLVLGARRPDLAELVHVPLGSMVFASSIALVSPLVSQASPDAAGLSAPTMRSGLVVVALCAVVVGAFSAGRMSVWLFSEDTASPPAVSIVLPDHGDDERALSSAEATLFSRHALAAQKHAVRGRDGRVVGEALVVVTTDLRSIHAPERCLAANGHVVVHSDVVERAGRPVKRVVLDHGEAVGLSFLRSARHHEVDLLGVRLARLGFFQRARDLGPWVFVSAVLDENAMSVRDEDALVRGLINDVDAALSVSPGMPP
jgi:exosortase O